MKMIKITALSILASLMLVACAASPNKTEVVEKTETITTRQMAQAPAEKAAIVMDRNIVSTIAFEPGRKGLSPEATAELNRVILEAKQRGEVQAVDVAVWSDMESAKGQKLPRQQVELAKERADNIEKYIDRMQPEADVTIHNMAQQPGSFANFLKTQDTTVKNRLAALGVAADETGQDVKARSSSALVFIKLK